MSLQEELKNIYLKGYADGEIAAIESVIETVKIMDMPKEVKSIMTDTLQSCLNVLNSKVEVK